MNIALVPPYVLRPIMVLAAMFAANAIGLPMNAATAAGAAIVATWFSGILQMLLINARLRATTPAGPRRSDFKTWFTISLPLLVILSSELFLQNTDILVISHFMTPADVGIYFAAGKTMALIMFVHYAVGSAVAHKYAALNARGDKDGLRAFVKDAVNWTFSPRRCSAYPGAWQTLTFAIRTAIRRRLLSDVHPCRRLSFPLGDGARRISAEHAWRAGALCDRLMCRGGFEHRAELRSGAGVWAGRRSDRNSDVTCRGGGDERHRRLAPARYRDTDLEKPVEVLTLSLSREPDFFHSMAASEGGHERVDFLHRRADDQRPEGFEFRLRIPH